MNLVKRLVAAVGSRAVKWSVGHPRDPVLAEILAAQADTAAGVVVTEATALNYSAVFAAVRAISEDIGKLPVMLYRRLEPIGKEKLLGHPLWPLVHDSPNEDMSDQGFRETITGWVLTWGNGYAEIERDASGRPAAMHILPSNAVMPVRTESGRLVYDFQDRGGAGKVIDAMNMLHVRGLGGDGIMGWSVIRTARESLGAAIAAEQYAARFFGNDARPGGILTHPGAFANDEARKQFKKSWQAANSRENKHKTALLEDGITWAAVGIPAEDAQLLETRQFGVEEVARWFRMPPHKLQQLLRSTFSNIEHQAIEYVVDTLEPWLARWEKEMDRKLLMPSEKTDLFIEHVVEALLRGDSKSRAEFYTKLFMMGSLSINEIRNLENQNPITEGGDTYYVPANMVPADQAMNGTNGQDGQNGQVGQEEDDSDNLDDSDNMDDSDRSKMRNLLIDAHQPLVELAIWRVLHTEADKTKRAIDNKSDPDTWLRMFYAEHPLHFRLEVGDAIEAATRALWAVQSDDPLNNEQLRGLADLQDRFAREHAERSLSLTLDRDPVNPEGRAAEAASATLSQVEELICQN